MYPRRPGNTSCSATTQHLVVALQSHLFALLIKYQWRKACELLITNWGFVDIYYRPVIDRGRGLSLQHRMQRNKHGLAGTSLSAALTGS